MTFRAPRAGFRTRFAPAPTGHLHLGHAVNAVWVWGLAHAFGGRVMLRLEDHDRGRCRADYEHSILDDLDWLGLVPDGATPATFRAGPHTQRQSDNTARYAARLSELDTHGLVYACRCSRAEIASPVYPGTCRHAAIPHDATSARRVVMAGDAPVQFDDLRLGAQSQDPMTQCGDLLARDRTGNWTYQFAVVVDDLEQDIDLIIRGEDLLESTGRQFRLARLLGRATMPSVLHHPLVWHPDGRKLSKSAGDTGLRELRAAGRSAAEVLGRAAQLGGLADSPRPIPAKSLGDLFDRA
jgi:glutamyl-tRNA synthetase/glutamyl-Q tRNA(Asp) synthetase